MKSLHWAFYRIIKTDSQLKTLLSSILLFLIFQAQGQWILRPIAHIQESTDTRQARRLAPGDTLNLPFWDDFSTSSISPDTTLWETGEDVFISPSIGIDPVTINVATFDGSTGQGLPHNSGVRTSEKTDSLVSKPINLAGLNPNDGVVLSFFWQIQGLGDLPGRKDQLTIYFRDTTRWIKQDWEQSGENLVPDSTFHFADIEIDDERYLHGGFQFMIQSVGSTGGPFDVWNVDYIYLDRGRNDVSTREFFPDLAVTSQPTSIFSDYTMIPRSQLEFYGDTIFSDMSFSVTNLADNRNNIVYEYNLIQVDTVINGEYIGTNLYNYRDSEDNGLLDHREIFNATVPSVSLSDFDLSEDTIRLVSEGIFETVSDTGIFLQNDRSYFEFEIDQVLAYDDGTAELSAGFNSKAVQIAIYYRIATMDTLSHVDIAFPRVGEIPDNKRFRISVATRLTQNDSAVISTQEFTRPDTIFSVDEFISFELEQPVQVSGGFYIMFEQSANTYFPIGLDVNTRNGDKIWINYGDGWFRNDLSEVDGSLMIRPRFGPSDLVVNSISKNASLNINIFPNPANHRLWLEGQFDSYEIIDLSGKLLLSGKEREVKIHFLPDGLYLIRFSKDQTIETQKLLISH